MRLLNSQFDLDHFFATLATETAAVLMVDYDGTLAPFEVERDKAVPYPILLSRLERLVTSGTTRLIIVSGRPVEQLVPLLKLSSPPEIWGCHGGQYRSVDGTVTTVALSTHAQKGLDRASAWSGEQGLDVNVEIKPTSIAFHWRGFPESRVVEVSREIKAFWQPLVAEYDLDLLPFDGGIELRPRGVDKGMIVKKVTADLGESVPVAFLGDDLTDEQAFAALPSGGLKVLVRQDLRETLADIWLRPPDELASFFDLWLGGRP